MLTTRDLAERAVEHGAVQLVEELAALVGVLPRLSRVLEIGTRFGGTAWLWEQLADEVVSVDVDQTQHEAPLTKTTLVQGDSRSSDTLAQIQGPFDLIFIDGDHSYETARSDYLMYSPLVARGGVVALHDICVRAVGYDGPARLWHELHDVHDGLMLSIVADKRGWSNGLGIGVLFW